RVPTRGELSPRVPSFSRNVQSATIRGCPPQCLPLISARGVSLQQHRAPLGATSATTSTTFRSIGARAKRLLRSLCSCTFPLPPPRGVLSPRPNALKGPKDSFALPSLTLTPLSQR